MLHASDHAVALAAQRLWNLLPGDLQMLPGHGPGQPGPGVLP